MRKNLTFFRNKLLINKTIIGGVTSLGLLQLFNLGIPLVRMPFVIHTLGLNDYGVFALALALVTYCSIFIDYGFNLLGTEQVARANQKVDEEKIFSNIIYVKIILSIFIFAIYTIIILSIGSLKEYSSIYLILYGNALGNLFFPLWFYYAKQSMGMITKIQVISQILQTAVIFATLNEKNGLLTLALITGLSSTFTGLIAFAIAVRLYELKLHRFSIVAILKITKSGWKLFLSRLLVNVYSNTNPILLATIGGVESLAIYTVAERVVKAASSILSAISTTLLPHMVKIKEQSLYYFKKMFYDSVKLTFIISFICMILIEVLAPFISSYFSNEGVNEIKVTLQILAISLLFEPQGGLFTNLMVTFKKDKLLLNYTALVTVINIVLVVPFLLKLGAYGIAASTSITQFLGFLFLLTIGHKLFRT